MHCFPFQRSSEGKESTRVQGKHSTAKSSLLFSNDLSPPIKLEHFQVAGITRSSHVQCAGRKMAQKKNYQKISYHLAC